MTTALYDAPLTQEEESTRDLAIFLDWVLKHYSTTNDGQFFGWTDSIDREVSSADISKHYKSVNI